MGEGTQEQTQGEGINLSSKWLAGHGGEGRSGGGAGMQTSLINRKQGPWELQPPPSKSRS